MEGGFAPSAVFTLEDLLPLLAASHTHSLPHSHPCLPSLFSRYSQLCGEAYSWLSPRGPVSKTSAYLMGAFEAKYTKNATQQLSFEFHSNNIKSVFG